MSHDAYLDEPGRDADSGWGWPLLSKKAHWFENSARSLCGKWLYTGPREMDAAGPDDCRDCAKRLAKSRPTARPKGSGHGE